MRHALIAISGGLTSATFLRLTHWITSTTIFTTVITAPFKVAFTFVGVRVTVGMGHTDMALVSAWTVASIALQVARAFVRSAGMAAEAVVAQTDAEGILAGVHHAGDAVTGGWAAAGIAE